MHKVPTFTAVTAILLIFIIFPATVGASISVGVKQGDWIEYDVNILLTEQAGANVSVSADHNITWAKMEVTQVHGAQISLSIQTIYSNGTITPANTTLDLQAGELGDDFIIPANLNVGDSFFDKNQGNITITGIGQRDVAGVQRSVISAATAATFYTWDQETGILLSAHTTLTDYTLATTTNKTSLSQSQTPTATVSSEGTPHSVPQIPTSNPTLIYAAVVVVAVLIIIGSIIMLGRRSAKLGKPQT